MTKVHFKEYNPNQIVLFPQRIDEKIAENDPVRLISAIVDKLDLSAFKKLYKEKGRSAYHPKMLLKVVLYAYMNNVYSCRRIEKLLLRDVNFMWISASQTPYFITINRFRNRVKTEINNIFTQVVLMLAEKGFVTLDVEYIDGTKIESKANKYTFVWKRTIVGNRNKLIEKIRTLLSQVDDCIAQDKAEEQMPEQEVEITTELLTTMAEELKEALKPVDKTLLKKKKKITRRKAEK